MSDVVEGGSLDSCLVPSLCTVNDRFAAGTACYSPPRIKVWARLCSVAKRSKESVMNRLNNGGSVSGFCLERLTSREPKINLWRPFRPFATIRLALQSHLIRSAGNLEFGQHRLILQSRVTASKH